MISDKDIIVELLRQREELREAASNNSEDHKVVNQLHATISALKKEREDLRDQYARLDEEKNSLQLKWNLEVAHRKVSPSITEDMTKAYWDLREANAKLIKDNEDLKRMEYHFTYNGMGYVVVDVAKHSIELLTTIDELRKENHELSDEKNRSIAAANSLDSQVTRIKEELDKWKSSYDSVFKSLADRESQVSELRKELKECHAGLKTTTEQSYCAEWKSRVDDLRKENTRIYQDLEAALEERDAWKIRHDDMKKRSIELRSKYDELAARAWPTTK